MSPDGKDVFWEGGPEKFRRWIGIDNRVITRFDDVMYRPEVRAPRTAVWVVRRGLGIWRIEATF
jgi:hypothetical protein